ncbi:hypothetical protein N7492_004387 [Penicillium capsulatum]|uniref:Uncharacterized protein n=1 Tax=Penicillium capsulatum TaxID=69766 RepID=A0A9W9I7J1_9EURO|nr:hypothetical protein N7492_004387 [Penicillium capsulatum]KAJ6136492.1 hypothetical protein N7512_001652 [Penicillium capsulatum]
MSPAGRMSVPVTRAQPQEYAHASFRSPGTRQGSLSSWMRQDQSPDSAPVAVVVRNSAVNHSSSERRTPETGERYRNEDDLSPYADAVEHHPYYMTISRDAIQPDGDARPASSPCPSRTKARGSKRAHEPDAEDGRNTMRKHGKRLTTREEVSLFQICIDHADTFGRRSDICNWWKTVAAEFTETNGRPYSWHSVRRKVETVTKQRIKFLEDRRQRQRDGSGPDLGQDMMNPEWCAVLDEWIPTWQRWEEAEARRIEQRDDMIRRRNLPKAHPLEDMVETLREAFNARHVDRAVHDGDMGEPIDEPVPAASPRSTHAFTCTAEDPFESPSRQRAGSVRMPPGFETMFSDAQSARSHASSASNPNPNPNPPADGPMANALIETLGQLNRHLDAATESGTRYPHPSPVVSALAQGSAPSIRAPYEDSRRVLNNNTSTPDSPEIARAKAELRIEMHHRWTDIERQLMSVRKTQQVILDLLKERVV